MGCPKLHEGWRFVSAETARYAYSPYGALVKSSGPDADENPFLFSSEYLDSETNLVYYNYRYYSPELGRWTKRDPIEEDGGWNLYGFVLNAPPSSSDRLGGEPEPTLEANGTRPPQFKDAQRRYAKPPAGLPKTATILKLPTEKPGTSPAVAGAVAQLVVWIVDIFKWGWTIKAKDLALKDCKSKIAKGKDACCCVLGVQYMTDVDGNTFATSGYGSILYKTDCDSARQQRAPSKDGRPSMIQRFVLKDGMDHEEQQKYGEDVKFSIKEFFYPVCCKAK